MYICAMYMYVYLCIYIYIGVTYTNDNTNTSHSSSTNDRRHSDHQVIQMKYSVLSPAALGGAAAPSGAKAVIKVKIISSNRNK